MIQCLKKMKYENLDVIKKKFWCMIFTLEFSLLILNLIIYYEGETRTDHLNYL